MSSTLQYVYATNLQQCQKYGYPLRNPSPGVRLPEPNKSEGLQIGDIGHVDDQGEFVVLFNIKFPPPGYEKRWEYTSSHCKPPLSTASHPEEPSQSSGRGPNHNPFVLTPKQGLEKIVLKTGVNEDITTNWDQGYKFTATSKTGAILILPDGAELLELESKYLKDLQSHVTKYALEWCRYAEEESLYLVTAVYRTKRWTLGSFDAQAGSTIGGEILVNFCDNRYTWRSAKFNIDNRQGPKENFYLNQAVLIKGFKMSVRRGQLSSTVEQLVPLSERWLSRFLSHIRQRARKLISESTPKVERVPAFNFSQPSHPLDLINHALLDKMPEAETAVTHDNYWIEMVENGFRPADLKEVHVVREFIEKECVRLDLENHTVYLQSAFDRNTDYGLEKVDDHYKPSGGDHHLSPHYAKDVNLELDREPANALEVPEEDSRLVITSMRLENFAMDHIDAGVCVLVQFGTTTRRTENKPHSNVIEWADEIMLPSDQPIRITVCGAFQLGSTLGTRKLSEEQFINASDLSRSADKLRLFVGKPESRCSLLITLERHFSYDETYFSYEEKSVFVNKTIHGLEVFYSHQTSRQANALESALEHFRDALVQCGPDPTRHATALFNLATSEFIKCQANGTYSELDTPISRYREALRLRGDGHPDRPATLLLLTQALLSRRGKGDGESVADEIKELLADVPHDNKRDRQAANAIIATCRFHQSINSGDPAEMDGLLRDLNHGVYTPLYGYFDRPFLVHKLGTAFWHRFQSSANLNDLENSITLNTEAFQLVPQGHDDRGGILNCLGNSLLCALEARGEVADLDVSAGLAGLGRMVVAKIGDTSPTDGAEAPLGELRKQIELMSAADATLQAIIAQDPSPRIPEVQSFIDEWDRMGGTPSKCKRELAVLLSFLGGEGEAKMGRVLEALGVQWSFKDHKIAGTTRALQGSMPYFFGVLAAQLIAEVIDGGVGLTRHSRKSAKSQ